MRYEMRTRVFTLKSYRQLSNKCYVRIVFSLSSAIIESTFIHVDRSFTHLLTSIHISQTADANIFGEVVKRLVWS